jgi:hypothetical protein
MGIPADRGPELAHLIKTVGTLIGANRRTLERLGRSDKNQQHIDPCAQ